MAAPVLVSGLTDWDTFEGTPTLVSIGGGQGGGTTVDYTRQGSQAVGRKAGSTGRHGFAVAVTATDMTVAGRYLWVWWSILYSPNQLDTQANGGVRVFVGTGGTTNYFEFFVGGSDASPDGSPVKAGKWYRTVIDLANVTPSTSGGSGATLTNVTHVGIVVNYTSTPSGNLFHYYLDGLQYGSGFQFTGGTAVDPVTIADIEAYTEDSARAWGIMQGESGAYFLNGQLTVGSGATETHFVDEGAVLLYRPQQYHNGTVVSSTITEGVNGVLVSGAGANYSLSNSVQRSVSSLQAERWTFDSASPASLTLSGNAFARSSDFSLYAGQTCESTTFDSCGQVVPGGATFTANTVKSYAGTAGAILWNSSGISGCQFSGNSNAVEIDTTGTYTFTGMTFSGNTVDINNTSGGAVTVNASGGSNPATYTGTVTINNTVNLTLTGLVAGSEVRILTAGTTTERDGVETSGTSFVYSYNYSAGDFVDIVVHKEDYKHLRISNYALGSLDSSLPVQQIFDRNYSNP